MLTNQGLKLKTNKKKLFFPNFSLNTSQNIPLSFFKNQPTQFLGLSSNFSLLFCLLSNFFYTFASPTVLLSIECRHNETLFPSFLSIHSPFAICCGSPCSRGVGIVLRSRAGRQFSHHSHHADTRWSAVGGHFSWVVQL